jgi:sRNA-binding regulator protein Hfq
MNKTWVNSSLRDKLNVKSENSPGFKGKSDNNLTSVIKKVVHSDNYLNKRIRQNELIEIIFINKDNITGTIEWFDQKYIKLTEASSGDHILVTRRSIKYIKKKIEN